MKGQGQCFDNLTPAGHARPAEPEAAHVQKQLGRLFCTARAAADSC